ncbi:MAG: DUF1636 domain-containing protein [Pseudomonadota bacterium]
MTCRDGREDNHGTRGGSRLAQRVASQLDDPASRQMQIRGVQCMSQCKRSCIVSLTATERFTYVFGDLDPENDAHVDALFELVARYNAAAEGFVERKDRPEPLQASILGRLPPLGSQSQLISDIMVSER